MQSKPRLLLTCIAATAAAAGLFGAGYRLGSAHVATAPPAPAPEGRISEVLRSVRALAAEPPPEDVLVRGAIRGIAGALRRSGDPYAAFYSPRAYESVRELTTGEFSGIGVWLKPRDRGFEVVSVLPRTPAARAGLQRGDVVTSVDGQPVEGMTSDEAVGRIKGPEGTEVTLGVARDGESLSFTLTRQTIELPNLLARRVAGDLGYLRLFGFARGAGEQLREEVADLLERGARGFVLDLRDNGGGLLSESVEVASVFVESGPIVSYRERGRTERVYRARGDAYEDVPLVVLVNEGTASASEIVTGALQDSNRAIVVGTRTYGKGSVQEVLPLGDASALKLTIGAYYTPSGRSIDGEGIEPDIEVEADPRTQRERAVEILRGILVSSRGGAG